MTKTERPFHEAGIRFTGWRRECDVIRQNAATLRAGAVAAVLTLGLAFGPDALRSPESGVKQPVVVMPEIVSAKSEERLVAVSPETTASFSPLRRRAPLVDEADIEPPARSEQPPAPIGVVDGVTLKAGDMLVRLAFISAPAPDRMCKRLDGLTVGCRDRAISYMELLVKGRAVGCHHAGKAEDGVDLGRCAVGETDLAEQMVRQGWASAAAGADGKLVVAEAAARKQKLGMWR
jgi:endonuclease YncB( thermonuclease family)